MKPNTEKVYQKLYQQAIEITMIFELIRVLFYNRENVDLMNQTSPTTFFYIQGALLDSVILKLAKITDPAEFGSNRNLSIDGLIQTLKDEDSPITSQLEKSKEEINSLLPDLRKIRNKYIAHTDSKALPQDLPKLIQNLKIDHAIKELDKFINIISGHYEGALRLMDPYPLPGLSLMRFLRIGVDANKLVRDIVGIRN